MQNIKYISSLNLQSISNINDVADVLQQLNTELHGTALHKLINFNKTYLIITQNVLMNVDSGKFKDKAFLHAFDAQFARYYLKALQKYVAGNSSKVAPAWHATFAAAEHGNASPLKILALGVNAHVNNDIPQVLRDCNANKTHHSDYFYVNYIIRKSIDESINCLQPHRSLLSPQHSLTRSIYKPFMNIIIRLWRQLAWQHFWKLQSREINVTQLESQAHIISRGTQLLPL